MYQTSISVKFPLGDHTYLTLQPEANDTFKIKENANNKNHILHLYMTPQQATNRC